MKSHDTNEDRNRIAEEKLENLLLEGLKSGEPIEVNEEFWRKQHQRILDRQSQKFGRAKRA